MKDSEKKVLKSLLTNKDFRDWVHSPSENRDMYWQKWIEANTEHEGLIQKAHNTVGKLKFKEHSLSQDRLEEILDNVISDKSSNSHVTGGRRHTGYRLWFLVAASVMVFTLSILLISRSYSEQYKDSSPEVSMKTIHNPLGRKSMIKLPDGSTVNLNAGSILSFPSDFSDSLREVKLEGEAYFDVIENKDRPFVVHSAELETQVLGTKFNVRAFRDDPNIDIALISGKVVVRGKNFPKPDAYRTLAPGEMLKYDRELFSYEKITFNKEDQIGWKDGVLVFDNLDFNEFIILLERWYGVDVSVGKLPSRSWNVHGKFDNNESLEEVLIGVQFTHRIDYEINDKNVRISCE